MTTIDLEAARRIADAAVRKERERLRAMHREVMATCRVALHQVSDDHESRLIVMGHHDAHLLCLESLDIESHNEKTRTA